MNEHLSGSDPTNDVSFFLVAIQNQEDIVWVSLMSIYYILCIACKCSCASNTAF